MLKVVYVHRLVICVFGGILGTCSWSMVFHATDTLVSSRFGWSSMECIPVEKARWSIFDLNDSHRYIESLKWIIKK